MENNEHQFIEGFNNGYLIAKHEPELLNKIGKTIEPVNEYLLGFISGKEEYEIEHENSKMIEIKKLRERQNNQEKDIEL